MGINQTTAVIGSESRDVSEHGARVRTPLPGRESAKLLGRQRDLESSAVSYPRRLPIAIRSANGSYIEDPDGNIFIDFLTGAGVLPLGHSHPEVLEAAKAQMEHFCHGLDFPTEVKDRFMRAQLSMLPDDIRDEMKVHFCGPTGADAVEAALKLCKLYTKADEVVSFQGAYHGCTHAAMSVTGLRSMKEHVGNRMPGVHFFPYSYCHRCPLGLARSECDINCAAYLEKALGDSNSGLGRIAAVLMELVQGEGGVIQADKAFVRRIRDVTAKLNIPLIVDEIQTGCGRTGTWYAFEQFEIAPDIVITSKGLSGMGAPVALMFYNKKMDVWSPGAHIGTFRGNQVAFAAGLATIDVIKREGVLHNVLERGKQLMNGLDEIKRSSKVVADVRGIGLMLGIEISDPATGLHSGQLAREVQAAALRHGLILEVGGRDDAVVRMLPPLNVSAATADEALSILRSAVAEAEMACGSRRASDDTDYII